MCRQHPGLTLNWLRNITLSPAVLAVAFVCSRWFVASNIIGATNIEQLKENLTSAEVSLAPDLIRDIDNLHLRYTNPAV